MTEPDPEIEQVLHELFAGQGGQGAAWTAKRLKTETATAEHTFDPQRATEVIAAVAQLLGDDPGPEQTGAVTLRGVVGSGWAGMNPAYVLAVVDRTAGRLRVGAHAKEGLIKQKTAQKAVQQVLESLPR